MHDFNFYTGREIIPVLSSPAELANRQRQPDSSYMLIKGNDLKKLGTVDPGEILMTESIGNTTWSLIALKGAAEYNGGITRGERGIRRLPLVRT
jgi:hypothetical protein